MIDVMKLALFRWLSAHSYKRYKQGCQRCETESLPVYMWVNDYLKSDDDDDEINDDYDDQDKAPHDSARCEACRRLGRLCTDEQRLY